MGWSSAANILDQWIVPLAAIATAYFTLKTWRTGVVLSLPYVVSSLFERRLTLKLAGTQHDNWQISKLILMWPLSANFEQVDYVYDHEGNPTFGPPQTLGRWLANPKHELFISRECHSVFVLARVALKAAPNMAKWRALRIRRND